MKNELIIEKKFNEMSVAEYHFFIDNHKQYKDFNTLGLYRSLVENEKLTLEEKLELRDYAHAQFQKTFDFLQLKDPETFIKVSSLGQELTKADEKQLFEEVRRNQQRILADKKIKHRNFGTYSKHDCGVETCYFFGMMIQKGSFLCEAVMRFESDKPIKSAKLKAERMKKDRKNTHKIIENELNLDDLIKD
jgi:hypothetical protein